jgi:hypothetical protein
MIVKTSKRTTRTGLLSVEPTIYDDNVCEKTHPNSLIGRTKAQLQLAFSVMFAVLPGAMTMMIPSVANGLVLVATSANVASLPNANEVWGGSSYANEAIASQNQSADAARLLLDDFYGKKRPKLPASVKSQMDLQDRRLANCQESSEAGNWEQCFFYGTDNAGSSSSNSDSDTGTYFGGGGLPVSTSSVTNTNGKTKIPTW